MNSVSDRLTNIGVRNDLSDPQLAAYMGVPLPTLLNWIAGRRTKGALLRSTLDLLDMIELLAPDVHGALLTRAKAVKPKPRGRTVRNGLPKSV